MCAAREQLTKWSWCYKRLSQGSVGICWAPFHCQCCYVIFDPPWLCLKVKESVCVCVCACVCACRRWKVSVSFWASKFENPVACRCFCWFMNFFLKCFKGHFWLHAMISDHKTRTGCALCRQQLWEAENERIDTLCQVNDRQAGKNQNVVIMCASQLYA